MTREQAKTLLESPILKAFSEGKIVQCRWSDGIWRDESNIDPLYILQCPERYRIKPEPREFWVLPKPGLNQVDDGFLFSTKQRAENFMKRQWFDGQQSEIIKVKEVL